MKGQILYDEVQTGGRTIHCSGQHLRLFSRMPLAIDSNRFVVGKALIR